MKTQDRILNAANQLFYDQGIRAVSVDKIAAKAGVTKRTLYYHFDSKDDLIAGYLTSRDQPNLRLFAQWFDETEGSVADKTRAIFEHVAKNARHPGWKGCGFQRTVAELANLPGHPAIAVGAAHKKKFEAWLSERFAQSGILAADALARSVSLLLEGTFATLLMHRDPDYAVSAGQAAKAMVDAQLKHTQ